MRGSKLQEPPASVSTGPGNSPHPTPRTLEAPLSAAQRGNGKDGSEQRRGPLATSTPAGWVGPLPSQRQEPACVSSSKSGLLRAWHWAGRDRPGPWPSALRQKVWPTLGVTPPHTHAHPSASSLLFLGSRLCCGLAGPSLRAQSLHKGWEGHTASPWPPPAGHTHQRESQRHGRLLGFLTVMVSLGGLGLLPNQSWAGGGAKGNRNGRNPWPSPSRSIRGSCTQSLTNSTQHCFPKCFTRDGSRHQSHPSPDPSVRSPGDRQPARGRLSIRITPKL